MFADQPAPHPFTAAEQARLATYRAAVRAGFYSDWLSGDGGPRAGLARPARPASRLGPDGGSERLWTAAERRRLVAYRAAVQAGLYSEQLLPRAQ